MVVEHCRTLLGWEGANSTECDEGTPHPVVIFMPEVNKKGEDRDPMDEISSKKREMSSSMAFVNMLRRGNVSSAVHV